MRHLQIAKFHQADVLAITKLKPELLQTWINRRVIYLAQQNPGSGRRRLYSGLDIVKLALMRRVADLRMELAVAREIASEAERMLLEGREISWALHISFKPRDATQEDLKFKIVASAGYNVLSLKYGAIQGDAREMRVSHFTEPFDSIFRRRKRTGTDERPLDPTRRDTLAKAGVHAEPAVIFPFGEIVNGTLLQIAALESGPLPNVIDSMLQLEHDRLLDNDE